MTSKQLWRGLATLIASIFVIVMSLSMLAYNSESDINQRFGTKSYDIVDLDDEGADTEYYKKKTASLDVHMENKLKIIEQLVDEGAVLVKNSGVLPLKTEKKVTLLGRASADLLYNGESGNATIGNAGNESVNLTLKKGMESAGFEVNPSMWAHYTANKTAESDPAGLPMTDTAAYNEAAIVVFSRNAGEGHDAADGHYELTETELALVEKAKTISEKVIVISNSPSPLAVDALDADSGVDAILTVGGVGAVGAKSLGNILKGNVNPSGRLVDIYAADSRSSAAYQNAGTYEYTNAVDITAASPNGSGEGNTKYVVQKEGIYIGYKYYETRYEDCVLGSGSADSAKGIYKSKGGKWSYSDEVTYSFGYGLSYTTFTQEITSFDVKDSVVKMTVKVKNTGGAPGKEVVQLYVQSPYTEYDKTNKIEKSAVHLVNFGKTDLLQPQGEAYVNIKMDLYNIASYDYNKAKTWILDGGEGANGKYYFAVGNGAHDALNNILAKKGKTTADGMDYNGKADLVREWNNADFMTFEKPEFSSDGFTTENGLFHNNTDTEVTNQFASADLNSLIGAGTVTYLSRNNWDGTWPTAQASLTTNAAMKKSLTFDGVYEKGSEDTSAIKYNTGTEYQVSMMKGLPYGHESWELILDQLMIEEMLVTVGKNFGAIDPILGISFPGTSDNDGVGSGPCVKYKAEFDTGKTPFEGITKYSTLDARMYPSQTVESSTFNQKLNYELGENMSEECFYNGMTSLWGPGLNLHRTPYSGRNFEYYSEDAMLTYIMGAQLTAGLQTNGVVAGPKHYAFNDAESDRYGYSVYINEQAARETSLRGFEGCVAVAKTKNIMTALNRIGCDWVGASEAMQNVVLRDEWGFDGYTLTDNALGAYMYGNCVALGTDKFMLLPGNDRSNQLNKAAVLKDERLFTAIRQATHRILYVYVNSKAMNGVPQNAQIVPVTPWWKATLIAVDIVLGVIAAAGIAMFVIASLKANKKQEVES